ncbi:MAG: phosphatase PAP2 family protein [Anaerolineae bacterium]|nr:phosphatase PAP2 family protein [Anaerolineae bacterium]
MDAVLDWGIDAIVWLRQTLPGLTTPFEMFTYLGNEMFYLLFMPFVYWCLDRRTGARLTLLFLACAYSNTVVKLLADQPRPFDRALDRMAPLYRYPLAEIIERYEASGGGFPSGHTQNTVVIWGYVASQFKRTWLWVLAGLLMLLVPLSRIYLAVHFPHDVLGGYVIGALLLVLYLWLEPKAEGWLEKSGLGWQLGLAVAIPILLTLALLNESGVTTGATLLGMGVGFVLERRWVGFDSDGVWWRRGLRYLPGVVVMFILYAGLKAAFSSLEPALLFRFVRYTLIGLWGGLGAPWAFVKLRLAEGRLRR